MSGKSRRMAGVLIVLLLVFTAIGCGKEKHPGQVKNETEMTAVESTQEKETRTPETEYSETKEGVSEDEIRPEVKEALDSYEEMMNEYCDFMEKYAESDDVVSMMGDYLEMMKVYAAASEKLDQIDEEELTDAELMYYLEVTNRVEKRLLEVSTG